MKKYFFVILIISALSCNSEKEIRKNFYSRESMAFLGNAKECNIITYDSFYIKNNEPVPIVSSKGDSTVWHFNRDGYITIIDQYIFSEGEIVKHVAIKYSFSNSIPTKRETFSNDTLGTVTDIRFINDTSVIEETRILDTDQKLKSTITVAYNKDYTIETKNMVIEIGTDKVEMTTTTNNRYKDRKLVNSLETCKTMLDGKTFSNGAYDYTKQYMYKILKKDTEGNTLSGLMEFTSDYTQDKQTVLYEGKYIYWDK